MARRPRRRWLRLTGVQAALTRNALIAYADECDKWDHPNARDASRISHNVIEKIELLNWRKKHG